MVGNFALERSTTSMTIPIKVGAVEGVIRHRALSFMFKERNILWITSRLKEELCTCIRFVQHNQRTLFGGGCISYWRNYVPFLYPLVSRASVQNGFIKTEVVGQVLFPVGVSFILHIGERLKLFWECEESCHFII